MIRMETMRQTPDKKGNEVTQLLSIWLPRVFASVERNSLAGLNQRVSTQKVAFRCLVLLVAAFLGRVVLESANDSQRQSIVPAGVLDEDNIVILELLGSYPQ